MALSRDLVGRLKPGTLVLADRGICGFGLWHRAGESRVISVAHHDPAQTSAENLTTVYSKRWEIESTFAELKTRQRGPGTVLRS